MKKKLRKQKKKNLVKFYLILYLSCLAVFAVSFLAVRFISVSGIPCANSITCKTGYDEITENGRPAIFAGKRITPPEIAYEANAADRVLGIKESPNSKHIYVDLNKQRLFAFDGSELYMETPISSGRWGRTPVGNYYIWSKFRSTRMTGGSGDDYYDLPNVPYTMFFYGDYGIHGAYWHNNFGHKMSHGCINMRIIDSKKLFEWADGPMNERKGTAVSICKSFEVPNNCVQE